MAVRAISENWPRLLLLVGAWFVLGCGDYTIKLEDGHRLMRISGGGRFVLLAPEQAGSAILVGPSVTGYHESEHLIIGRVENLDEQRDVATPGFFILDKRSGHLERGMTREEWEEHLQRQGLEAVPRLRRPNRLQSWG